MRKPEISIIVPAYNSEKFIGETLESVMAQRFQDWECIVVDDGSEDDTWGVVSAAMARDRRIRGFRQQNAGVSQARNAGVAMSAPSSEFLAFLDNDDLYAEDAIDRLIAAAGSGSRLVGAHGRLDLIDAQSKPIFPQPEHIRVRVAVRGIRLVEIGAEDPSDLSNLIVRWPLTPGVGLFRRSAVAGIRWDPNFRCAQDLDYWIKTSRRGQFAFVDEVVLHCRRHSGNVSNDLRRCFTEAKAVIRAAAASPLNSPAQRELFRRYGVAWHTFRSGEKWREARNMAGSGRPDTAGKLLVHSVAHLLLALKGLRPSKKPSSDGPSHRPSNER